MPELCASCREFGEITSTDSVGRPCCSRCQTNSMSNYQASLIYLLATIPHRVGDRVQCRTAGTLLDGTGVIDDISMEVHNGGTPVWPSFHVVLSEKAYPDAPDDGWYTENDLTALEESARG